MGEKVQKRSDALMTARNNGLHLADHSLDAFAQRGGGPPYTYGRLAGDRAPRALYTETDLLEWVMKEKARRGLK
jgi:hypothetical protein